MMVFRHSRQERGQALAELVASLFGILFVVLGILALGAIGIAGIKNQIAARSGADENTISQILSDTSEIHITEWKNPDGLKFTADDSKQASSIPLSDVFMNELSDTERKFSTSYLDAASYSDAAFESKLELSSIFVSAAGLTAKKESVGDPFRRYDFFDLKRILRNFGLPSEVQIEDTVYMPYQQNSN